MVPICRFRLSTLRNQCFTCGCGMIFEIHIENIADTKTLTRFADIFIEDKFPNITEAERVVPIIAATFHV